MLIVLVKKTGKNAIEQKGVTSTVQNKDAKLVSDDVVQDVVKRRKRNRPDLDKFGEEHTEPGDNARYLRFAMASLNLPPIDISDPKQVESRINEYFNYCIDNDRKPNMVGMANWLGVSRETLNMWKRGEYRGSTHHDVIKRAVGMLEELWVDYMQNGKANPASLIFLGKNMFGYKDTQDVIVTPNNPLGNESSAEEAQKRIESGVIIDADALQEA